MPSSQTSSMAVNPGSSLQEHPQKQPTDQPASRQMREEMFMANTGYTPYSRLYSGQIPAQTLADKLGQQHLANLPHNSN
ncbi:uncharacterized protein CTRU02_206164 [Colletotrichum truncatum]|uniref:Uncharacterized protein n=1 Tax=Colletotrichum truncatum TaxID=5467 RepID=A0ACC3Z627_COLTU|nr:uncharacterized protein CTRU02_10418 [Colletotrichum truncatum]KAF6787155.1 hypothetical protein CTRU02_10418 [Colletotrichum truncatum]